MKGHLVNHMNQDLRKFFFRDTIKEIVVKATSNHTELSVIVSPRRVDLLLLRAHVGTVCSFCGFDYKNLYKAKVASISHTEGLKTSKLNDHQWCVHCDIGVELSKQLEYFTL